ncbi:MAG: glycerol-3-phosphate acyltransferase, partial [Gammaproteobacteria bacterium]|nr:glycerol-3-phosphate acyltransferase [Gammaproteobacteria bacterium]
EFNNEVRAELDFFDPDWERKLRDDAEFGASFLRGMAPLVAQGTLRPYIEGYRIVADVFARLPADQTLDEKAVVTASFKYGRQAYLQRRISSKASIGDMLFKNGLKLLDSYGLVAVGEPELLERRKQTSRNFRILSHRLEHLRALAMPGESD